MRWRPGPELLLHQRLSSRHGLRVGYLRDLQSGPGGMQSGAGGICLLLLFGLDSAIIIRRRLLGQPERQF